MKQIDDCEWIENEELTDMFRLRTSRADVVAFNHTVALFDTYKPTIFCSHLAAEGEAFTLEDWIEECRDWVWKPTQAGKALGEHDRMKQRIWVNTLLGAGTKSPSFTSASLTSLAEEAYVPSVDHIIAFGLDESGVVERYAEEFRKVESEQGTGAVAALLTGADEAEVGFGPAGYGMQGNVKVEVVDESQTYFYGEILRTKSLLERAAQRASGITKTHYQTLLRTIENKLDK